MREIRIDLDTVVGFDFEKQYYYITNKNTTTTRTAVQDTLDVLDIVAPDHTITENGLISLAQDMEALTDLYYTWEDTGAYIKAIQLNDYSKYPLVLDGNKKKIYILNSTIIFDLTLNDGLRPRLEQVQAFYRDTLGLYVNLKDLEVLYKTLVSFYNPVCYNTITINQDYTSENYTLQYDNTLKLSNYRGTSLATYTCTLNPTNQYNHTPIGSIKNITDNVITLTAEVPTEVHVGSLINIINADTTIDTTTYSANGTYTVQSVTNNQITTTENLPADFNVTLPTLNIVAYKNTISAINSEAQTITLTNSAEGFSIGDTIVVQDTVIQTDYETLSVDGFYSIIGIEDNILYVDEQPTTDYTSTSETAYVYKPITIGEVIAIEDNTITLGDNPPSTLTTDTPIVVFTTTTTQEKPIMQYAEVLNVYDTTLLVDTSLIDNVQKYGVLRNSTPFPYTLIKVENSKREDILPNGEFMVDTPEQAIEYIGLLKTLVQPINIEEGEEAYTYIGNFTSCGMQVPSTYMITDHISSGINPEMECLGVYSKVYSE